MDASMTEQTIRPADAGDYSAVRACSRSAYRIFAERLGYEPKPMVADYLTLIAERRVWVLVEGATLAGVLVLLPEPGHLLVYSIAVQPERQGKGYGRRLVAFAENLARDDGYKCVSLYTNERMAENVAFYEALGYQRYDRREHETRPGSWVIYLRKSVG